MYAAVLYLIFTRIAPWRNERLSLVTIMDTSPTALFDSYEQDFRQFIETIREKLEDNASDDKGGESYRIILLYIRFLTLFSYQNNGSQLLEELKWSLMKQMKW